MAEKYGKKVRELMVKEMKSIFDGKKGFLLSSYNNIKASEIDKFRKKVKDHGSKHMIIKKRLSRIALEETGLSDLKDAFQDQKNVGITVIENDPVAIAKLLKEFAKSNKNFSLGSGCLEGRVLSTEKVKELADLPGREQLLAQVVGTLNAPVTGFVGVFASMLRSVCYAFNAVKEKKESNN
jgi:large subunit ribosomal protein L10